MKRGWRRLLIIISAVLLALFLVVLGSIAWLHTSGRLATLAQDLLQRLSGEDVTFNAMEFPSWDRVAFTGVRLQRRLGGWHLDIVCPRLEARYGLRGLFSKQVESIRLRQLNVQLQPTDAPSPTPLPRASTPAAIQLPVKRLIIQQGELHVRWHDVWYDLRQLEANLQQQDLQEVSIEASGTLGESLATFRVQGHTALDRPQPTGSWELTTNAMSLSRLVQAFPSLLPPALEITQGTLDAEAQVEFRHQTLHGTLKAQVAQGQLQAGSLALHNVSFSSDTTIEANPVQQTLLLEGKVHLQAESANGPADLSATRLTLDTPLRLSYNPEQWLANVDLAVYSQTLQAGDQVRIQRLSSTVPLQAQSTSGGVQLQGTAEIAAHAVHVGTNGQAGGGLQIDGLRGQLPLRVEATTVEITQAHIQATTWRWVVAGEPKLAAPLEVHLSSLLDLQRQRLHVHQYEITLPGLGSSSGSAAWHWPSQTVHDLRLQVATASVETLWRHVAPLVPAAYHAWKVAGQTRVELQAPRFALQSPWDVPDLTVSWHVQDVAFSSPDRTYAGEHLNGTLQATASLSSETTIEGNPTQRSLLLEGKVQLQVERANGPAELSATRLTLDTPLRLSYTSEEQWLANVDLAVQSQTVAVGDQVRIQRLSSTLPLQAQSTSGGVQLQGTAEVAANTVHISAEGQVDGGLQIDGVHGQFPLRVEATTVEITQAQIQTNTGRWVVTGESQLEAPLEVHLSSRLDLQRQRLHLHHCVITLPGLGSSSGSAVWHWPSQTVHDLRLQVAPASIEALWSTLAALVPEAYHAWQAAGQTRVELQASRFVLRAPWDVPDLTVNWHVQDVSFSSPDSTYAGEHLNGTFQATASLDSRADRYMLQGTLTLQPFAVLIGTIFPAIEENGITSVVTLSGTYSSQAERLRLYIAGQFADLGTLTVQGQIRQPLRTPHFDLQWTLSRINAAQVWNTFMSDADTSSPELSQATVQGTLNAVLHLSGQSTAALVQGSLDLTELHLQTTTMTLEGASLRLPLQIRYPLPPIVPDVAALPADAYGRLHMTRLRLGGLDVEGLDIKLALRSDTVFLQENIRLPLLGGHISLRHFIAQNLLRTQRRLSVQARLHRLNLQRLARDAAALPLAGIVNGDFTRVQVLGNRLETKGALTLQVAGGRIRLFDVQGRNLFSSIPTLRCSLATEQPLSLLQLTRIYPIGDMGGTLHVTVDDLTITAGEPAAFHLTFNVQEKRSEKRAITLRALNNLLFTTGSARVETSQTYSLPYRRFGADITLRHDILQLRGLYHDRKGREYFMRAPRLGGGVSIVNRVPKNGIPFRDFLQRLKATVLENPDVRVR